MHRIHGGLTVVAPVLGGKRKELGDLLKLLNNNGSASVFDVSDTTLFAAGVILPPQLYCDRDPLPESLVFATTYCGPLAAHLDDLIKTNFTNLRKMFSYCNDRLINATEKQLIDFIKKNSHTGNFCSRFNLITKKEVGLEKELRENIGGYIDKAQDLCAFDCLRPTEIKTLIYRHLKSLGDEYAWAFKPFRKSFREWLQTGWLILLAAAILLPLLYWFCTLPFPTRNKVFGLVAVGVLVVLLILIGILWFINRHKPSSGCERPPDSKVKEIAATQLNPVVNGMTAAAPLKGGFVRRYFYFFVLKLVGLVAHIIVKVPTVSSIRWLSVDHKRRLLFLSNYSNTTDFYVRDFLVGGTPKGVNFMFSNGEHFPDAKLSYLGGISEHPERYMNAVHTGQHVMDLWYTHENSLTVDMINRNRAIRKGLVKRMNDDEAREWLRLL